MTRNNRGKRRDPKLKDFYHDMNQHAAAEYRRVAGRYVVELDTTPGGWSVTVWEAVKRAGNYVHPDAGENRYVWDAVGRETFAGGERQEPEAVARSRYASLTSKGAVRSFCQTNPYEGPRTPYHEQQRDE